MYELLGHILKPFNLSEEQIRDVDSSVFLRGNLIRSCIEAEFALEMRLPEIVSNIGWDVVYNSATYCAPYANILPETPAYIEQVNDHQAIYFKLVEGELCSCEIEYGSKNREQTHAGYVHSFANEVTVKSVDAPKFNMLMQLYRSIVAVLKRNDYFSFFDNRSWEIMNGENFIKDLLDRTEPTITSPGRVTVNEARDLLKKNMDDRVPFQFVFSDAGVAVILTDLEINIEGVKTVSDISELIKEIPAFTRYPRITLDYRNIAGVQFNGMSFRYRYLCANDMKVDFIKRLLSEFDDWHMTLLNTPVNDIIASMYLAGPEAEDAIVNSVNGSIPVTWRTEVEEHNDVKFINVGAGDTMHSISIIRDIKVNNGYADGMLTLNEDVIRYISIGRFTIKDDGEHLILCNQFGMPLGR